MPRKRYKEEPVEDALDEVQELEDEDAPVNIKEESESQIEEPPVKPKTIKQISRSPGS